MAAALNRPLAGIGLRLLAALALSVMFATAKLADERGAHLVEIVFWRQAFVLPIVLAVVFASGQGIASLRTAKPRAHLWRMIVGLSGMCFNFWAVTLLPLAESTTFGFTVPIFATILSALVLGEATGRHRWAAVIAGFVGVLIVLQPGDGHVPLAGALVALTGAVLTASVTILIRQLGATERATTTVFWFSASSLVPMGIALPFFTSQHDGATWGLLLATGIAGGIAQLALTGALRLAPVAVVLPMDYSSLIWATALGWLLFGVLPAPLTWLGAPIIIASGLYIVWREHRLRRAASLAPID
ncbi:DMT family transporter [Sphingomonas japonica]|uniref:Drug/metabolite transporter (DMT)-like permease n=1 Tax=Sphingomonas japonica TaxID=511662 RepID=A0ABX0TZK6_9SPHN|nr:DMT family transporter [Sphingomonas japonica]NIJ22896.1 drug/metabolite transporter (DMT)-like permease [Sphingomonas japonica]